MARILLAEDDATNRLLFTRFLEKEGLECIVAEDGQEAIDIFQKDKNFDLIILDQKMPYKNGSEVLIEIKKATTLIPIVALTGDDSSTESLYEIGFSKVIIKPFRGKRDIPEILKLID